MRTIDTINSTMLVAIELSASSWLVAARVPGSDKPHLHRIDGGDTMGLLAAISSLRDRVARRLNVAIGVVCCFEAGRDGFWLHRLLTAHGLTNYVLDPTSILVHRRARRAKTDRLDAIGMLRVLAAYIRGDRQSCSMVRVPTPDEEDAKRIHREPRAWSRRGCALRTALRRCCLPRVFGSAPRYVRGSAIFLSCAPEMDARCHATFGPNWTA